MAARKKSLKHKLSEYTYYKPGMGQRAADLKKSLGEISILVNGKGRK